MLLGAWLSMACQAVPVCDDDALRQIVAAARSDRDSHPQRLGQPQRSLGADFDTRGLANACQALPPTWRDVGLPGFDEAVERLHAQRRVTCPGLETARAAEHTARHAGPIASGRAFYDACDLGRFQLVDPVRYTLSYDAYDTVVLYDQMIRREAAPELAVEIVGERFWHSPFTPTEALLAGLPATEQWREPAAGLGVRLRRDGVGLDDTVWPISAMHDVAAELAALRERWTEPLPVIVVADADVGLATMVAFIDALRSYGVDQIHAGVLGRGYQVVALPLVESPSGFNALELCIDPATAWATHTPMPSGLLLAPRSPAQWEAVPGPQPGGYQNVPAARVTLVGATSYPRLLEVLDRAYATGGGETNAFAVTDLVLRDTPESCTAWHAALEAARADAAVLQDEFFACERRGRRSGCRREVCKRAREHVARHSEVFDHAARVEDAERMCR